MPSRKTAALNGPTGGDTHWQAKDRVGFAAGDVVIDGEQQHAVCPLGQIGNRWTPAIDRFKSDVINIALTMTDGRVCPALEQCTKATPPHRTITLRPHAQHEALLVGCQRE